VGPEPSAGIRDDSHCPEPMTSDEQLRLSEETAARLWKRAAELQSEAASRSEATSPPEADSEVLESDDAGYALAHVRQAAVEAGISKEFVDAALTEMTAQDAVGPLEPSRLDALAQSVLGPVPELLEVRRDIAASAREVSQAMERILLAPPYGLAVRDVTGDFLNGGVMVFDVPPVLGLTSYTAFQYECSWASIKQLMISIHPAGPDACRLVVRSSTRPGRRLGAGIGAAVTGVAGLVGAIFGLGVGVAIGSALGVAGGSFAAVAGGLGLAVVGGVTAATAVRAAFRKLFRYGLGRGRKAMEGLTGAIKTTFVVGWGG
jgi:eukaryotic-like serine/threonine-protein kinase